MAIKKPTTPNTPSIADVAAAFRLIADAIEAGVFTGGDSTGAGDKYDRDETEILPISELRGLAKELGLDEQKVKKAILDEMESKGLFADSGDEDEDDEDEADDEDEDEGDDEEEDEDDEEEEELSREELEEMSLADLKALAKENGHNASVYRKMDQDALVELLAPEEDDEDEEEEEEEEEEIDEDALKAMDLGQLKKVAADLELKVPVAVSKNKNKLVNFILENAGVDDDE